MKNKKNFIGLIEEFNEKCEDEEFSYLLTAMTAKLNGLGEKII